MGHGAPGEPGADPAPHTNMGTAMHEIAFLRRELTEAVAARNGLQVGHDRLEREKTALLTALKKIAEECDGPYDGFFKDALSAYEIKKMALEAIKAAS